MSKMRRNEEGKFAKAPSKKMFFGSWIGALLSLPLLWFVLKAVLSNFASFRSCNSNNNGITVVNCGKQGLNLGDVILLVLLAAAGFMAFSLWVHSIRMSKRMFK